MIHKVWSTAVATQELPVNKSALQKKRPASASQFRGGFAGVGAGPQSTKARVGGAVKMIGNLFSVFDKKGSTREVLQVSVHVVL